MPHFLVKLSSLTVYIVKVDITAVVCHLETCWIFHLSFNLSGPTNVCHLEFVDCLAGYLEQILFNYKLRHVSPFSTILWKFWVEVSGFYIRSRVHLMHSSLFNNVLGNEYSFPMPYLWTFLSIYFILKCSPIVFNSIFNPSFWYQVLSLNLRYTSLHMFLKISYIHHVK